jgi:cyclic-di-GMP phosphodiesterase TipF (flagellum assembly factor)
VNKARGAVDPLATEIGELGALVQQIADTVAMHESALQQQGAIAARPAATAVNTEAPPLALSERDAVPATGFRSQNREHIVGLIAQAVDEQRIDLYLQPIVTLPQRKVRYYEALSRLRTEDGDIVPAADFVDIADDAGLMPKIDNLLAFRCVQITRRLQLKSRDVGLFMNVNAATLTDSLQFRQLLDFMTANRAIAGALTFEFTQAAYRNFGPIEHEGLAALAELGFRFSMDHVTDLRMQPKELADHAFRYLKVPAKLLLGSATGAQSNIHPEDLADLLARSGIDLIAERIENEAAVVDLLDYDVRFGQGFLFSAPRPVRSEALQDGNARPAGEAGGELAAAGMPVG